MLSMLIAYDIAGDVVASLDQIVIHDNNGNALGLVDFEGHEHSGGRLRDIWDVGNAIGSGTWPEWLGGRALDFKTELTDGRISALVHKNSGHRRERADIEAAIAERRAATPDGAPVDLRDVVGGPQRPLALDEHGRTKAREPRQQSRLPLIRAGT